MAPPSSFHRRCADKNYGKEEEVIPADYLAEPSYQRGSCQQGQTGIKPLHVLRSRLAVWKEKGQSCYQYHIEETEQELLVHQFSPNSLHLRFIEPVDDCPLKQHGHPNQRIALTDSVNTAFPVFSVLIWIFLGDASAD